MRAARRIRTEGKAITVRTLDDEVSAVINELLFCVPLLLESFTGCIRKHVTEETLGLVKLKSMRHFAPS